MIVNKKLIIRLSIILVRIRVVKIAVIKFILEREDHFLIPISLDKLLLINENKYIIK